MIGFQICRRMGELESSARGQWSEELLSHASGCGDCAAYLVVDTSMTRIAAAPTSYVSLPSAKHIWFRAELVRRQQTARRVLEPLSAFNRIAYAMLAGCWIVFAFWQRPFFAALLEGGAKEVILTLAGARGLPVTAIALFVVLSSITVTMTAYGAVSDQ